MDKGSKIFVLLMVIGSVAINVAVSMAIFEWTGNLEYPLYPGIEEVYITSMTFDVPNKRIMITASNTLDIPTTITEILVNNVNQTNVNPTLPSTITANNIVKYNITLSSISKGYTYQVRLVSLRGNSFLYTATAPS